MFPYPQEKTPWRHRLYQIIYEADTPAGKWFDIVLIGSILLSVASIMLNSVTEISAKYGDYLHWIEWFFTSLFTIEYILRIICIERPSRYVFSFFGMVDLISILPTYLSLIFTGLDSFHAIRILRILRIFRVLKLAQYLIQINILMRAVVGSRRKITVFLFFILTNIVVFGSIMYVIEGPEHGFTSIPKSIYWAIVTLTTVGYGDISPQTDLGQALASMVMILGYSIIAVPTGIFTAELSNAIKQGQNAISCDACKKFGHDPEANYCNACGSKLTT